MSARTIRESRPAEIIWKPPLPPFESFTGTVCECVCNEHPSIPQKECVEQGRLLVPQNLISPEPRHRSRRSTVVVSSETVAVERGIFMKFKTKTALYGHASLIGHAFYTVICTNC